MDAAPSPNPAPPPVTPVPPPLLAAWPRSAQLTTAFLLGVSLTLLAIQSLGYLRGGSRPTDLERDAILAYRIDLNRADRAELLQLPGVGDGLAERIQAHRREHGPFQKVDDLVSVRGIGPTTLEKLRPWVIVHTDEEDEDEDRKSTRLNSSH